MTLQLQLSPDVEAKLRERATLTGQSLECLVLEALNEKLAATSEPENTLSPRSWLAEFDEWLASHPASQANVLDDSRESIYNGRGG